MPLQAIFCSFSGLSGLDDWHCLYATQHTTQHRYSINTLHNTLLDTGIVSTRYTTHFSIQHLCTTLLHIGTVAIHYTPHHAGTVSMHLHTTLYTTRVSIHCTPYLYSPIMLFYSPIMLVYSLLRAGTGGR